MKILVLAPHPFYIDRGTPIDLDILLRALSNRGEAVDVLCFPGTERREYPGVEVLPVDGPEYLPSLPPGFSFKKVFADTLLAFATLKQVRRRQYDVVHAGEEAVFIAQFLRLFLRLPYVYDMDSSLAQQMVEQMPSLKPFRWFFQILEGRAIRKALAIAPVCDALAELGKKWGAAHIETLYDISQLSNPDAPPGKVLETEFGITRPVLLYAGNLRPYQGVDLLMEAFALALEEGSGLDLVVVGGSDEDIAQYRGKASNLGIEARTHFLGLWPNHRIGELLAEAAILTSPRTKGVNTPMKVFPYLHSGRPVIVTDLPTHTQVLDSSVAVLSAPRPEPFSQAILRVERDTELQECLRRNARALIEARHTFPAHEGRVNRLYDQVRSSVIPGSGNE